MPWVVFLSWRSKCEDGEKTRTEPVSGCPCILASDLGSSCEPGLQGGHSCFKSWRRKCLQERGFFPDPIRTSFEGSRVPLTLEQAFPQRSPGPPSRAGWAGFSDVNVDNSTQVIALKAQEINCRGTARGPGRTPWSGIACCYAEAAFQEGWGGAAGLPHLGASEEAGARQQHSSASGASLL